MLRELARSCSAPYGSARYFTVQFVPERCSAVQCGAKWRGVVPLGTDFAKRTSPAHHVQRYTARRNTALVSADLLS